MNSNHDLDKEELIELVAEIEKMRRDTEKRRNRKYWSEISVPFTLDEVLINYTKEDLNTIRKSLEIPNASTLRKAELATLLASKIPACLEAFVFQLDVERFKLLLKIARNGGKMIAPDLDIEQIIYFRSYGIVYTGTLQGEKVLALPTELIEPIIKWGDDLQLKRVIKRNTEWIKLTRGLLYFYGTLDIGQLFELLAQYTKEEIDGLSYFNVIFNANLYEEEIEIGRYYSHIEVPDPERVYKEHRMRPDVPYYPFTKQQLLQAGVPHFVHRNKSYQAFVQYLTDNFEMSREVADEFAEDCMYGTKIGDRMSEVFEILNNSLELNDMQIINELTEELVHFMNNTREWFLKGNTSTELFEEEKKHLRPLPEKKYISNPPKKQQKIGRNEPCPCGSGKKYKKCCGSA